MNHLNVYMHLPPRKRLLAGLRREKSFADALPPITFISSDLGARIRDVIDSPTSSPEDIVEVSKSVAAAAVEIATAARDIAMEKEAAAAKARVAAKNALEFLDSISRDRIPKRNLLVKNKARRKEVPIKLFYKMQSTKSDEDMARRLHCAMNSSTRISNSKQKNISSSAIDFPSDDDALCSRNLSICGNETAKIIKGPLLDKMEEKIVVCSEVSIFEEEEEKEELWPRKINKNICKARDVPVDRKLKIKQKKLLSHYDASDKKVQTPFTKRQKLSCEEKDVCSSDAKPSNDASAIVKITSLWKCKKLKMTKCSSDNKILPALC